MEAFSLRTAGLRCEPLAVVDDVINAFHDSARAPGPEPAAQHGRPRAAADTPARSARADVCDAADAIEAALKAEPSLKDHHQEIEKVRPPSSAVTGALAS